MNILRWLRSLWWARQRAIDLQVLWPACKERAPSLELAKVAFAMHAYADPAWVEFYGEDELAQVITAIIYLTGPE